MNVELTVRRHASWWVIGHAIGGLTLIIAGLLIDRLSTLIVGVWLALQAQLHLILDELRGES